MLVARAKLTNTFFLLQYRGTKLKHPTLKKLICLTVENK